MGRAWIAAPAVLVYGCSLFVPGPKSSDGFTDGDADDAWDGMDGVDGLDSGDVPPDDLPGDCTTGDHICFENDYYRCNDSGTGWERELECGNGQVCEEGTGCISCTAGQMICLGTVSVMCDPGEEMWLTVRDCEEWGSTCGADGYCDDACGDAEAEKSHLGCEFWAVPLPNPPGVDTSHFHFGITVINPNADTANIRVIQGAMDSPHVVGSNEINTIEWNLDPAIVGGLPEGAWRSFFVMNGGVRIVSDIPVGVMQMIPKDYDHDGRQSTSAGSSLLIPRHSLANSYIAASVPPMSRHESGTSERWASYVAVVAVTPGTTPVRVEPGIVLALDTGGRLSSGTFTSFDLEYGEVVVMAQEAPDPCAPGQPYHVLVEGVDYCYNPMIDPSNARIWSDQPVAVFGGAVNQQVPFGVAEADHLEEQMPPEVSFGQSFVTAPMYDPGETAVTNMVRIVFTSDGTQLTIDPVQDGHGTGETYGAGGTLEFELSVPVWIETTSPVLVAQNLVGRESTEPAMDRGDPAMTIIPPVDQHKTGHVFACPGSFTSIVGGLSFVMVMRPTGASVLLDGAAFAPTGGWHEAGTSRGWEVGTSVVTDGHHVISASEPVGVQVFGLGPSVAYAHPAGMHLDWINTGG